MNIFRRNKHTVTIPDSTSLLNQLLSADLTKFVTSLDKSEFLTEYLTQNRRLFEQKLKSLRLFRVTPLSVNKALQKKIRRIEQSLRNTAQYGDMHTVVGVRKTAQYLHSLCPIDQHTGSFLTEAAARRLLHEHPPVNLMHGFSCKQIGELWQNITPLDALAIVRHTETSDWNDAYLTNLSTCTAQDFEQREVRYFILDRDRFHTILALSEQDLKPWRISHSKETGTINLFVLDQVVAFTSPLLLCTAVYLHYFYETAHSGAFVGKHIDTSPEEVGAMLVEVILGSKKKFPFFQDTYCEQLFWRRALTTLASWHHGNSDLHYFADTICCGEFIDQGNPKTLVSLNLVDILWDTNIPRQHVDRNYFRFSSDLFLYHFREGLWYDIFRTLLGYEEETFHQAVIEHLHIGDELFTAKMMGT